MEWFAVILGAFLVVLIIGGLFALAGVRGPWPSLVWFFAVMFLATLAIGVWSDPAGPRAYGVPWVGLLVTAIFVGLLIASAAPDYRHGYRHVKRLPLERDPVEPDTEPAPLNPRESRETGEAAAIAVSTFFWVFLILALAIVLARIFTLPEVG